MADAFDGITPFASSSTPQRQPPYDVFINHRGPDVKLKLASPIYHALEPVGVKAFLDKELELGAHIPQAIEDAMRSARIHIAIFSKDYVTSPWCLAELSFMVEKTQAPIIPVFYEVEPAELRWRVTGESAEVEPAGIFSKHASRYSRERVEKWKTALQKVANIKGCIVKANGDDCEKILLNKIVDRVLREMKKVNVPFEEVKHPVGLDKAVRDFDTFLESAQDHQGVKIVGIAGVGGCGKTTLARKFCNLRYSMFDSYSFLSDVRKATLRNLLKKLLVDLTRREDIPPLRDASELKAILAGRLKTLSPRVLIILDDVDQPNQLKDLLPDEGKSLRSGSLVIITTRDRSVLQPWYKSVHESRRLDGLHAKELFCWHAFLTPSPPEAFSDLVEKFTHVCKGLPLFIEVIAAMLFKKPRNLWICNLDKISRAYPEKVTERLRPVYDALDKEEKDIFLDVACFFVGEKKKLAIEVWNAAGWNGLDNLVNKCLVQVDKQNRIRMNDILRDLGRQIAIESRPHRIWDSMHIDRIRESTESKTRIRGIMAAKTQFVAHSGRYEFPECDNFFEPPFQECMNLRPPILLKLLVVAGNYFTSDFAELSVDLVWLRWFNFQHRNVPSWLSMKKLRVLELYGASSLQNLWENNAHVQRPVELREMIVTATKDSIFDTFPSIILGLTQLTKIALISYHGEEFRFIEVPDEFCNLQSLEHLELRHCKYLSKLPTHFGKLGKLRHLDLCSCRDLCNLPDTFKELTNLEYLDLSGCKTLDLKPDILVNIRKLESLHFSGCRKLQKLPPQIAEQKSLRELHLKETMLIDLPTNIGQLSKLENLVVGSWPLTAFPTSLGNLSSLTRLRITRCTMLESLPESIGGLKLLEHLCIKYCKELKSLPEGLRQLVKLQYLRIIDCDKINKLDFWSGSSSPLCNLKVIHLKGKYTRLSISKDCCPNLETLQLEQNDTLKELLLGTLPRWFEMVNKPQSVKEMKVYERRSKKQKIC